MKRINIAGITGFFLCLGAILFGVVTNGGIQTLVNYLHLPSLILTVCGALFAVLATADSFEDFIFGLKGIFAAYQKTAYEEDGADQELVKDILETELYHKEEKERKRVKFWQDFGMFAPA